MKHELTAHRLRTALIDAHMRPQELSDRSGVSKASISQYVNGSHAPSNGSSKKMGAVLKVNPLWLMGFDVPMHPTAAAASITLYNVHCETENECKLILNFRELSDIGKKKVSSYVNNTLEIERADVEILNAAHARTDIDFAEGVDTSDDDIMDSEDF